MGPFPPPGEGVVSVVETCPDPSPSLTEPRPGGKKSSVRNREGRDDHPRQGGRLGRDLYQVWSEGGELGLDAERVLSSGLRGSPLS